MIKKDLDFKVFHQAAERVIQGDFDLYNFKKDGVFSYKYSPVFPLMIYPLGYLSRNIAQIFWSALNTFLMLLAWFYLLKIIRPILYEKVNIKNFNTKKQKNVFWIANIVTLILLVQPIINNAIQGNINGILFFMIIASIYYSKMDKSFLSAFLGAIATSIKLTPAVVIFYYIYKKDWAAFLYFCFFMILFMIVIPVLFYGVHDSLALYANWKAVLADKNHFPFFKYTNQSPLVVFIHLGFSKSVASLLHYFVAAINFSVLIFAIKNKNEATTIFISLILMLILPPVVWLEYYIVLIPMVFYVSYCALSGAFGKTQWILSILLLIFTKLPVQAIIGKDLANWFAFYGMHFWGLLLLSLIYSINFFRSGAKKLS